MKYKVLAADDEYWSRENLRSLISWEDYSIEFLDPACDGEEVLERIEEEKPDIILTDINMPFLSGLELLQKLQTEHPEIITIAVSGYDDFDKVKGVFVSGGLDYILKPVGKEELVKILTKALGILEEREMARKHKETNQIQEHKISSFLEDSEYSALLSGKLYGQFTAQPHVSSTKEFSGVAALMVKFYNIAGIAEKFEYDNLQMSLSIKTRLRNLTGCNAEAIIFNNCNKMSEFLIFTSYRTNSLRILAENILEEFPLDEYGPVSVILHEQTGSLDDIGSMYRDMVAVLVTRSFTHSHCILACSQEEGSQSVGKTVSHRIEEEVYHFLNTGQKSETAKLIFRTCDFKHCDNGEWSFLDVKQYVRRITGILYRYVQEQHPELTAQAEEAGAEKPLSSSGREGPALPSDLSEHLRQERTKEESARDTDENELYEAARRCEGVRLKIVGDYLSSLKGAEAPLMKGGTGTLAVSPAKPKSISEAGNMALRYFKKGTQA